MSNHHFLRIIKSFLPTGASYQVRELYLSSMIINFAIAMASIFEPIYLYKIGFSLSEIIIFFLGVYVLYLFVLPFGAKFALRFGYEKAMMLGTPFWAAYFIFLFFADTSIYFLVLAGFLLVLQKTFYWPGYNADFARFGKDTQRGREVSNMIAIISLTYIVGPFLGGIIISLWGFQIMFVIASILILASNLPLLVTPEKFKASRFSYKDSFKRLFYKENRRNFFALLGFGEEFVFVVIWPIFIFTVLNDFFSVGTLVALATFVTTLTLMFVGKLTDKGSSNIKRSILKIGSIFTSLSWLLRLLVQGGLGVFMVDTLARVSKYVVDVPLLAMIYEYAGDTSVMKTMMFLEMTLVIAKIAVMVLSLIVLMFVAESFVAIFVISALMSLLYPLAKYDPVRIRR